MYTSSPLFWRHYCHKLNGIQSNWSYHLWEVKSKQEDYKVPSNKAKAENGKTNFQYRTQARNLSSLTYTRRQVKSIFFPMMGNGSRNSVATCTKDSAAKSVMQRRIQHSWNLTGRARSLKERY